MQPDRSPPAPRFELFGFQSLRLLDRRGHPGPGNMGPPESPFTVRLIGALAPSGAFQWPS